MRWKQVCRILLLYLLLWPAAGGAEEKKAKEQKAEAEKAAPEEKLRKSRGTATIAGRRIEYTATAGTILLKDKDGKPQASIFFIAYSRDGAGELAVRPVTFAFNGGPGSSSVWLHLGALGPRRVMLGQEAVPEPPPYRLQNNEYSLLDLTDLVFIDPVTTGFSRAAPGENAKQFHEVEKDIESVAEFIRLWITRNGRWASPKYVIGESYGATRAAGLAEHLQEKLGMDLNGLMLVSPALNFQAISFDSGNDLPYILYLPAYAATAWYHRLLSEDLQRLELPQLLDAARAFARGPYAQALLQGDALPEAERRRVAAEAARLTGLSPELLARARLRLPVSRFTAELLKEKGRVVGRFDSRFTGIADDPTAHASTYDPSYAAIYGAFSAALKDYVHRELGYESDLPYEIIAEEVRPWDWGRYENRYLNMGERLSRALTRRPQLRLFVAAGHYDLATSLASIEYTLDHLELDPSLRGNLQLSRYETGHMPYLHEPSLARLREDLSRFIGGP